MQVLCRNVGVALLAVLAAPASHAKEAEPAKPQAIADLIKCKEIASPQERLACFDLQVDRLGQATSTGEVIVTDRRSLVEAKKGLFGFKTDSFEAFLGREDEKGAVKSIEANVVSARQFGYGSWRIKLDNGALWEQVDQQRLVFDPTNKSKVLIDRGALGTYRMSIDGQRPIKVRRVE